MNRQSEIHLRNYLAFAKMLEDQHRSPERLQLLQEELARNEEFFLRYAEGDYSQLEHVGLEVVNNKIVKSKKS